MRARAFTDVAMPGDGDDERDTPDVDAAGSKWTIPSLMVVLLGVGLAGWFAYSSQDPSQSISPSDYAARTEMVLRTTPLIDGHNDLPFLLRLDLHNQIYNNETFRFRDGKSTRLHDPLSWAVASHK